MRNFAVFLLLTMWVFPGMGQNITAKQADSLRLALPKKRPDTSYLNALVFLADYNIAKPGENKVDLDSAAAYLTSAKELNKVLKSDAGAGYILLIESYLWKERGRRDTARTLCARALAIMKNQKDKSLLGKAYYALSEYYDFNRTGELAERIRLVDSAISAYKRSGQTERMAFCLKVLADLHINQGEYSKALSDCNGSLQAYQSIHFGWIQPVYDLIGSAYREMGDYKAALTNELLALKIADDMHDSSMQRCEIEYNIGNLFEQLRDSGAAILHLVSALKIADLHNDMTNSYVVAGDLTRLYARSATPGKSFAVLDALKNKYKSETNDQQLFDLDRGYIYTYIALKQFHKAQPYVDDLIRLGNLPGTRRMSFCNMYLVLTRFYIAAGRYSDARTSLVRYRDSVVKLGDPRFVERVYQFAFMIDTAGKQYKSGIANLLRFDAIRDSMDDAANGKELEQMNIAFETSEKEKHIQALEDDEKFQAHALAQTVQFRNLSLAVVALLLLFLGLGYSRFRLKQQKNLQLEVKQRQLEISQQEISAKNVELGRLLTENEWLLREVHHRVKNNLQVIKSLLHSQSVYIEDEGALKAIREGQHRVQAMSLIHQKLYKSNDVSSIYMPEYVNDLVEYLKDSFKTGQQIVFYQEVEVITLDVLHAVPVGLILNELITNAIKYAFPNSAEDLIIIKFFRSAPDELTLVVGDNGRGLPPNFNMDENKSFGMLLITGLTEDLGGKVSFERKGGTTIRLTFPTAM